MDLEKQETVIVLVTPLSVCLIMSPNCKPGCCWWLILFVHFSSGCAVYSHSIMKFMKNLQPHSMPVLENTMYFRQNYTGQYNTKKPLPQSVLTFCCCLRYIYQLISRSIPAFTGFHSIPVFTGMLRFTQFLLCKVVSYPLKI